MKNGTNSSVCVSSNDSVSRSVRQLNIADGRFVIQSRIGSGAFGEIFQGVDKRTDRPVALKLEKRKTQFSQLLYESKVYRLLQQDCTEPVGFPRIYHCCSEMDYNIIVMDLCGPSLEDLFNYCGRRFSLNTVCMLADQMLCRLEFLHRKGFIHRDIKPENFVCGIGKRGHIIHLIDFGLSKMYWNKRKQTHIPYSEGKSLIGTARYCSTWTHKGFEQSRRDDLEAIGFILIYFFVGSLPWQGITTKDPHIKTIHIGEKKQDIPLADLCSGLPVEMLQFCTYCRELRFADKPDYDYLRNLFFTMAKRHGCVGATTVITPCVMNNMKTFPKNTPPKSLCNAACKEYNWMFDWFVKRNAEVERWNKCCAVTSRKSEITRGSLSRTQLITSDENSASKCSNNNNSNNSNNNNNNNNSNNNNNNSNNNNNNNSNNSSSIRTVRLFLGLPPQD